MSALMADAVTPAFPDASGREWTLADLARLPAGGSRYEIIDGSLVVSPTPNLAHGFAVDWLHAAVRASAPPGTHVMGSGVGVVLPAPRTRLLVPDVVAFRGVDEEDDLAALEARHVVLAVEVVSPGSTTMDRLTKPALYAGAGIPHFWRVEPSRAGPTVNVHTLVGGVYRQLHEIDPGDSVDVAEPWAVTVAPRRSGKTNAP